MNVYLTKYYTQLFLIIWFHNTGIIRYSISFHTPEIFFKIINFVQHLDKSVRQNFVSLALQDRWDWSCSAIIWYLNMTIWYTQIVTKFTFCTAKAKDLRFDLPNILQYIFIRGTFIKNFKTLEMLQNYSSHSNCFCFLLNI